MAKDYEERKKELLKRLSALKSSKDWLDGDKKAEAEVASVRGQLRALELENLSPRQRIEAKCDFQAEVQEVKDKLAQARVDRDPGQVEKLESRLEGLTS